MNDAILVTGATGLIGGDTVRRLLARHPGVRVYALVRDPHGLPTHLGSRVAPVQGDLSQPGLGLDGDIRRALRGRIRAFLHFAADTRFSQTRAEASAVNVRGTERALALAADLRAERFVLASTAFAVGCRTGTVRPDDGPEGGWINQYERSKHEAEAAVLASGIPAVILRPSTVVYDAAADAITQRNAVHRALRIFQAGLAAMVPGDPASPVDLVTADYVADGCARLALHPDTPGRALHLCAGNGAMALGDLLDAAHDRWALDPGWRRRRIERPAITDLRTWRLMERSVEETGSPALVRVTRALSHFAPQLAYPKRFDTSATDALLGEPAPPVASYWDRMLARLGEGREAVAA